MAAKSGGGNKGRQTTTNSPHKGGPVRRIVEPNKGGGYRVVAPKAERASAVEPTKKAAANRAKTIVTNLGGGEVTFKDDKGKIVNSNTVGHGNRPAPAEGRQALASH